VRCLKEGCSQFIGPNEVLYPQGGHHNPLRTQNEYDHPIAKCSSCGALHVVAKMMSEVELIEILKEQ
jgi:hypothetical protein